MYYWRCQEKIKAWTRSSVMWESINGIEEEKDEGGENFHLFLLDIMQDNSCKIDLDETGAIQKPKQVIGFNTKGKLSQGQSASLNGVVMEHLNDIELPKELSRNIKTVIIKA